MLRPEREPRFDHVSWAQWNHVRVPLLLGGLWAGLVVVGIGRLEDYAQQPGAPAQPPVSWPATSSIARKAGKAQLIMLVHPRCPCTRASVEELSQLMAHGQGRVQAHVLFIVPEGTEEGWAVTDLWRSAGSIPGVEVLLDKAGREASRFRVATSGETLLYGPDGGLLFGGGITESRGHSGDNAGREAILSLLLLKKPETNETPVFGCPLFDRRSVAPPRAL